LEKLFAPFQLGRLSLKNRIVMAPMSTGYADGGGLVTDLMVRHYRRRAEGGAALLIVEPGVVHTQARLFPNSMGIWTEEQVGPLAGLAGAVHRAGAHVFLQLCHAGPKARSRFSGRPPLSASDIPLFRNDPPQAMTRGEIDQTVEDFVRAAARAARAGLDGVELHAAHFYLLSAFLSRLTNGRADDYGGSPANRSRLVVEIIRAIKRELGPDYPVVVRFNAREYGEGGIGPEEALQLAGLFVAAGADALHVSAFDRYRPELAKAVTVPATAIPGPEDPEGVFLLYAREIKKTVACPVIGVGRITDPVTAGEALTRGDCDLTAVGRALLVDPDWPQKAQSGGYTPCQGCGDCLTTLGDGGVRCAVNPEVGR